MRLELGLDLLLSFIPSFRKNLPGEISRYGEMRTQLLLVCMFITLPDSILPLSALMTLQMTGDSEYFFSLNGCCVADIW